MKEATANSAGRRAFLRSIPAAAATGIAFVDLLPALSAAQNAMPLAQQAAYPITKEDFKLISADELAGDIKALQAKPGTTRLYNDKNFVADLWLEQNTPAREFEWHDRRDHVVHVLEGTTDYEIGGTPQGAHSIGPGEWLAPATDGAKILTLKKGDMLVLRRGTPHRRTTHGSVTFIILSPTTPLAT